MQLAGLDLGKIQHVVDQTQQTVRGGIDPLQVVALLGVEFGAQGQAGHADDGVHGGADFVAHVGQKITLALVGRFGLLLGQHQGAFHAQLLGEVQAEGNNGNAIGAHVLLHAVAPVDGAHFSRFGAQRLLVAQGHRIQLVCVHALLPR